MNKIKWTKKAKKDIKQIAKNEVTTIFDAISTLEQPQQNWTSVKKLKNHKFDFRLRVGSYRVIFDFEKQAKIISIEQIGARDDRTY